MIDAYDEVSKLFGFLGNLRNIIASEITNNCTILVEKYSADINNELINDTNIPLNMSSKLIDIIQCPEIIDVSKYSNCIHDLSISNGIKKYG